MIAVIARSSRRRAGITLTEILIAILIMGVGLISLATLFPLGLLRLREGTRQGRAGLMFETAADDMDSRGLLFKQSFSSTWYGLRDPFKQDAYPNGAYYDVSNLTGLGVIAAGNSPYAANLVTYGNAQGPVLANLTTGLPVCYDPLWRSITGVVPPLPPQPGIAAPGVTLFDTTLDFGPAYVTKIDEARFGSGLFTSVNPPNVYIDNDRGDGGVPSAHGLQRITNFIPWSSAKLTPRYSFTCNNFALGLPPNQPADVAGSIFASGDDIVFNPPGGEVKVVDSNGNVLGSASSVLPDLSTGAAEADYRFTWFFTGRQVDTTNSTQFIGEIVVCDGRPFGFDPLPGSTTAFAPAGETVVEAIYGVGIGASIIPLYSGATVGYAVSNKSVLLRWKSTLADPPLRAGGWIADTTYERYVPTYRSRVAASGASFARCNWYQIAKRVDPTPDANDPTNYRSAVVTLVSPVKNPTLLYVSSGLPVHSNIATIMPSVINVFARTFEVR